MRARSARASSSRSPAQARQAQCGAQLEGVNLLPAGNGECQPETLRRRSLRVTLEQTAHALEVQVVGAV